MDDAELWTCSRGPSDGACLFRGRQEATQEPRSGGLAEEVQGQSQHGYLVGLGHPPVGQGLQLSCGRCCQDAAVRAHRGRSQQLGVTATDTMQVRRREAPTFQPLEGQREAVAAGSGHSQGGSNGKEAGTWSWDPSALGGLTASIRRWALRKVAEGDRAAGAVLRSRVPRGPRAQLWPRGRTHTSAGRKAGSVPCRAGRRLSGPSC